MEGFISVLEAIDGVVWGPIMLVILVGSVASCLHFYAAMAIGHAAAEWIDEPQLSERLFGQKKNKKKQKLKYSWALESPIAFCLKILELFFSFATKI